MWIHVDVCRLVVHELDDGKWGAAYLLLLFQSLIWFSVARLHSVVRMKPLDIMA